PRSPGPFDVYLKSSIVHVFFTLDFNVMYSVEPPFDVEEDLRIDLESDILTLPINADAFEFEDVELDIPIMPNMDKEEEEELPYTPGGTLPRSALVDF